MTARKPYTIPAIPYSAKDITLGQAVHLLKSAGGEPSELPTEELITMLSECFGVERSTLNDLTLGTLKAYERLLTDHIASIGLIWGGEQEAAKENPSDLLPGGTITIDGETLNLPKDLRSETRAEQWIHLEQQLSAASKANAKEVEVFAIVLALLLYKDGEDGTAYKGSVRIARHPLVNRMKFTDAARIMAFFFSSSTDLAACVYRYFPQFEAWLPPNKLLDEIRSLTAGVTSSHSSALRN